MLAFGIESKSFAAQRLKIFKTIAGSHVELYFTYGGLSFAIPLKKRLIYEFLLAQDHELNYLLSDNYS